MFHSLQRRSPSSVYSYCVSSARLASLAGGSSLKGRVQQVLSWFHRGIARGPGQSKSLLSLLASQCSYVTSLRVRRAQQIGQLYSNIYSERTRWSLWSRLWRKFHGRHANACKLMAALGGIFVWEEERIKEEELRR